MTKNAKNVVLIGNQVRSIVAFVLLVFFSLHANATPSLGVSAVEKVGDEYFLFFDYDELVFALSLPAMEDIGKAEQQLKLDILDETDWHILEVMQKKRPPLHETLGFDLERFRKSSEEKRRLMDITIAVGDWVVLLELIAIRDPWRIVSFYLHSKEAGSTKFEITPELADSLKRATSGSFEVVNSELPRFNTGNPLSWDTSDLSGHFKGAEELESVRLKKLQEATAQAEATEKAFLARIKEYRATQLPADVKHLSSIEIDESLVPEPNHRLIDRVCYKALYPYYAHRSESEHLTRSVTRLNNLSGNTNTKYQGLLYHEGELPVVTADNLESTCERILDDASLLKERANLHYTNGNYGVSKRARNAARSLRNICTAILNPEPISKSSVSNKLKRCLSPDKIAKQAIRDCSEETKDCACVYQQVFDFWDKNNKAATPIDYQSKSALPVQVRANLRCSR